MGLTELGWIESSLGQVRWTEIDPTQVGPSRVRHTLDHVE